jgi:hypothetical protein
MFKGLSIGRDAKIKPDTKGKSSKSKQEKMRTNQNDQDVKATAENQLKYVFVFMFSKFQIYIYICPLSHTHFLSRSYTHKSYASKHKSIQRIQTCKVQSVSGKMGPDSRSGTVRVVHVLSVQSVLGPDRVGSTLFL